MRRYDRTKRTIRLRERPESTAAGSFLLGELRASGWCGGATCPRTILTADTAEALAARERAYRCASCGRPDWITARERRPWLAGGRLA